MKGLSPLGTPSFLVAHPLSLGCLMWHGSLHCLYLALAKGGKGEAPLSSDYPEGSGLSRPRPRSLAIPCYLSLLLLLWGSLFNSIRKNGPMRRYSASLTRRGQCKYKLVLFVWPLWGKKGKNKYGQRCGAIRTLVNLLIQL